MRDRLNPPSKAFYYRRRSGSMDTMTHGPDPGAASLGPDVGGESTGEVNQLRGPCKVRGGESPGDLHQSCVSPCMGGLIP